MNINFDFIALSDNLFAFNQSESKRHALLTLCPKVTRMSPYRKTMNDFPVIGDLVMRAGLWDRQGANIASRYKEMYGVELFLRLKAVSLDIECRILP